MSAPAQDTPAEDPLQSPPQSPIISDPTNRPGLEEIWSSDIDTFITTYLAKVKKDKGLKRNTFTVPIWKAFFTHNELKDRFKILKAQAPQSTSTPTPSIPSTPAPPSSTSASSLLLNYEAGVYEGLVLTKLELAAGGCVESVCHLVSPRQTDDINIDTHHLSPSLAGILPVQAFGNAREIRKRDQFSPQILSR
ncbi:hypothetical protein K435DRAFT_813527 [Dendrothele bispora CBS 962.96]|uniref:Uncharacterized protein n=1 Tax=Dendrothele bispora (strain CBS 962.96) TaxID=1314807 RepID=A0A4S8KLB6_DENBC|nr:hypothetical protein K435DRAFT_813527 [Dendrothele bispora CBS 962.96]